MKFSAAVVAAFAATVLAVPTPAEQAQTPQVEQGTQPGADAVSFYEEKGYEEKSLRICSKEKGKKNCIEIDEKDAPEPKYKCKGKDGYPDQPYKSKCEEEYEKKLIEAYKRKKAFKEFEKKREFEEYEKLKEIKKYLREHKYKHKYEHDPEYRELKEFKEKKAYEEYKIKQKLDAEEKAKKLAALKDKFAAEEAIDTLCEIRDKDGKCKKLKEKY